MCFRKAMKNERRLGVRSVEDARVIANYTLKDTYQSTKVLCMLKISPS